MEHKQKKRMRRQQIKNRLECLKMHLLRFLHSDEQFTIYEGITYSRTRAILTIEEIDNEIENL